MTMRIGQLARRTGLAPSALRYYEEAGLLRPASRSAAGYRLFGEDALGRLSFIQRAQSLGLSIRQIRDLVDGSSVTTAEERDRLRHVVAHKLAETERRLTELDELRRQLEGLYIRLRRLPGPECGHVGDCACWLPTDEEVKTMTAEIERCGQACCECCSCSRGEPCDCPECPCNGLR